MTTFTSPSKHSATFINTPLHAASPASEYKTDKVYFLNAEDGSHLLIEALAFIIAEQTAPIRVVTNIAKS